MAAQVPSRLYRSRSQKMISGVCGGLGEYFDVDPVLIRLLFVVTAFISGMGILAYIVLWIVVPFEGDDGPRFDALKRDFEEFSGRVREYVDRPPAGRASTPGGDAPPSGNTAAGETSPAAPPTAEPATARHTTRPYEDRSMNPDTASARVPLHDDPPETASPSTTAATSASAASTTAADAPGAPGASSSTEADELTIGSEPPAPPAGAAPRDAASASRTTSPGTPLEDLYGPPSGGFYGPPPPFESASYTAAPPVAPASDRRKRRQHWAGAILIVLGLLILGNNVGLLWWVEPEYILPLILVGAGAWLLFGRGRRG